MKKLIKLIQNVWYRIPIFWQGEIKSGWHTFFAGFVASAGVEFFFQYHQILANGFPTIKDLIIGVGFAIVRAGVKNGGIALWNFVKAQWDANHN